MGGGARGVCSVDSRVWGQASWGATLALPFSPFAEQLGFNPSPAAYTSKVNPNPKRINPFLISCNPYHTRYA